jgi:Lon protease-like protein
VKYYYHWQKVVWDKISNMVCAGHKSNTAIDAIYDAYGRAMTVTAIINQMRQDKKTDGHPNLRV